MTMKTFTTQHATLTVDYDRPITGYADTIDRSKEQDGTEAAIKAIDAAIADNPAIDDDTLSRIAGAAFDAVVGTADNGGYTIAARRITEQNGAITDIREVVT